MRRTDGRQLAVWQSMLGSAASAGAAPADLERVRHAVASPSTCAVIMMRGGHFSGAVFALDPVRIRDGRVADKFTVLQHKSVHRYVIRAKAGGKQSSKDASGKFARSAGARLRRYNEVSDASYFFGGVCWWRGGRD